MLILTVNAQDLKERTKVRSGTSVAANYRSTCRSCSHAEFISKIGVVEEKVDETSLWPELIVADKSLPEMLNHVADFYDEDVNLRSTALLSWVEPVILLFVAAFVAFVLISLYMPIFSIGTSVQS